MRLTKLEDYHFVKFVNSRDFKSLMRLLSNFSAAMTGAIGAI
jgi:hypothetical protein